MKKLITFLGTGFYDKCIYTFEHIESRETHFIQTAIYEVLKEHGEEIDELYLFLTPKAKEGNFTTGNVSRLDGKKYEGLKTVWEQYFPTEQDKLIVVDIEHDQSEAKQWELFEQIFDIIDENDELYIDITHSFRSIPLVSLIIANYAKTIKNAKIKKLLYGNFEQLDKTTNKAPIVDITSLANLLDWTTSVESFLRTGNPTQIQQLTKERLAQNFKDVELKEINRLTDKLVELNENMVTSRGTTFEPVLQEIDHILQDVKDITSSKLPQMTKLFEKIEQKMELFEGNTYERMWGAIKWCVEHELYQQAFTFAREFMITIVVDQLTHLEEVQNIKKQKERRALRDDVSAMILHCVNPNVNIKRTSLRYPTIYDPVIEIVHNNLDHFKVYDTIVDYRNNINHAGYEQNELKFSRLEHKSKNIVEAIKPLFFQS